MENVYALHVDASMVAHASVTSRLRQLRLRAGLSMREMAHIFGLKDASGYQRYEDKGLFKKDWLPVDKVAQLAKALEGRGDPPITMDEVYELAGPGFVNPARLFSGKTLGSTVAPEGGVIRAPTPLPDDSFDKLPVRSGGRGGPGQEMFLADGPVDYVPRPDYLKNVRNAYAIYLFGNSMSPRYRHGQRIDVNPARPYAAEDGVVVTKTDNTVLVKEFVALTETAIRLREYKPKERTFDVPLSEIVDIHRIVAAVDP